MGWRFRKTVRVSRWVRLNVSGSGLSLGLGPRGANINISKRGLRRTVGLPGTGLSHQTFTKWSDPPADDIRPVVGPLPSGAAPSPSDPPPQCRGALSPGVFVMLCGLGAVGLWGLWPSDKAESTQAPTTSLPAPPAAAETFARPATPAAANRPLEQEEVREAQTLLKSLGFDPGGADGIVGPMTIGAVKRYEAARGWSESGAVDLRLLEYLQAGRSLPTSTTRPPSAPPVSAAPQRAAPSPAPPQAITVVPSEEMRLATRVLRDTQHPCPMVAAAVRLSDGSIRAVCSNSEIYRVMQYRGEWLALKCSAAQRAGVQGC